ncbi:Hypothetical protein Cp262_2136 [Corynebacterium pseudotuberculosis]|nr:Hypothetical protein Cp262_2136 [Corynebacterium pseudotuberculosis]
MHNARRFVSTRLSPRGWGTRPSALGFIFNNRGKRESDCDLRITYVFAMY